MNTEIKDFPRGVDEKGLLYLIWQALRGLSAVSAASAQSDWNESDSADVAYIKNKPEIPDVSGFVAPLVVEGTVSGGDFTAGSGQPSLSDALVRFVAGGVVLLAYEDGSDKTHYEAVVGCNSTDGELSTANLSWS